MPNFHRIIAWAVVLMLSIILAWPLEAVLAAAPAMATPAGLSLLELKVTGDEFVLLQNNSGHAITDLSQYWIDVFNSPNPLAAGVSNSSQQLPNASLQAGQTLLLSADPMQTCGASVAGELSVSLSDSGGFLQLTRLNLSPEGAVAQAPGDFVGWSSTTTGIIRNVPSNSKSPRAAYYRYFNGNSYVWQQADLNASDSCQLNIVVAGDLGSSSAVTPLTLATTSPPATILGTTEAGDGSAPPSLPEADVGLTAPQISELLPNPVGTGTDAIEEFIELYNPNPKPFDLSGFTLQTGTATAKNYTFPTGTILAPQSFKALYAPETKLTLSNTSSQAALLDPFDKVISSSDVYSSAKDGIAWAAAKGAWYWTTQVTPGAANVIKQPPLKKSRSSTKKKPIAKRLAINGSGKKLTENTASNTFQEEPQGSVVHSWVLAGMATLALLYGAYEYRRDITNRLYQLRAKFGARRKTREEVNGR